MIAVPSYNHMGVVKADTGIRKPVPEGLGVGKHDKTCMDAVFISSS